MSHAARARVQGASKRPCAAVGPLRKPRPNVGNETRRDQRENYIPGQAVESAEPETVHAYLGEWEP
eukprot:CAMPEP_0179156814 /NCGR_PEP_ID=MMETSP0796-20121207/76459_1 /TAXON_ID=73915 /ORGANISM="Pyrodinium bahamense, Strain pbaha01" /LENGTH=65 /DNA_ID=CAMNT_0020858407 /DNA_START=31 /DNA_END=225 /DNA_ORIENTATION=-